MCTGGRAGVHGLGFRPSWKANFEYPLLGSCLVPSQKHYCTTVFRYAVPGNGSINKIWSNQRTRSRKILIEMLPPPVRGTLRLGQKWPVALTRPIWNRAIPLQLDKNIFLFKFETLPSSPTELLHLGSPELSHCVTLGPIWHELLQPVKGEARLKE